MQEERERGYKQWEERETDEVGGEFLSEDWMGVREEISGG